MPQRRLPLGSGWLGSPAPFSLDDPSSKLILRHNANAQSDGAGLAIAKRQAPLSPRQQQVETFPLYTPIEKKYLESVAVVKQKNRVYLPILNHNQRKYGDGKLYRTQRKNRGHHFNRVRYADMDGKLIPVRVIRQPGQRVNYEIYDVRHSAAKGFPIKFDGAAWVFDKPPAEPLQTRHLPYRGGANRVNNLVSPPDMDHVFLRFG